MARWPVEVAGQRTCQVIVTQSHRTPMVTDGGFRRVSVGERSTPADAHALSGWSTRPGSSLSAGPLKSTRMQQQDVRAAHYLSRESRAVSVDGTQQYELVRARRQMRPRQCRHCDNRQNTYYLESIVFTSFAWLRVCLVVPVAWFVVES